MKRLIQKMILKHQLATAAAHLEALERQRVEMNRLEHHLLVKANLARIKLLNLDIRNRHA